MTTKKVDYRRSELAVHIPDTRGVHVSPWGRGNLKLGQGEGFYTYSKLPGLPSPHGGSCPGATDTCLRVCYAFRVRETPLVWQMWEENTKQGCLLPRLPRDAEIVRLHVAGDFDTKLYVTAWYLAAEVHPDVHFFGYTRSWRVPELLPELEKLRALPNVQLFASVDASDSKYDWPSRDWRWAWLGAPDAPPWWYADKPYRCPEEDGRKKSCEECNYCILGRRGDVVFQIH